MSDPTDPLSTLRKLLRAVHTPGIKATPLEILALACVARREPCPTSTLARSLSKDLVSNVRRLLLPLERAGYLEWTRQRGRARSSLRTTPAGRELLRALAGAAEGKEA